MKEGDNGSAEDIGRMPRGVLDARTEVAVFSLSAGDVSEVLETPRDPVPLRNPSNRPAPMAGY